MMLQNSSSEYTSFRLPAGLAIVVACLILIGLQFSIEFLIQNLIQVLYKFTPADIIFKLLHQPIDSIPNPEKTRNALLIYQGLTMILSFGGTAYLYFYFIEKTNFKSLHKNSLPLKVGLFLLVITCNFILLPLASYLQQNFDVNTGEFFEKFSKLYENLILFITGASKTYQIIFAWMVLAVLPAFFEEIIFRGIIQNQFLRLNRNKHLAVWSGAILFSLLHFEFQGFLARIALGGFLGYIYLWTNNLIYPMIAHFINNSLAFWAAVSYQKYNIPIDPDKTPIPWYLALGSVVIAGLLLYFFKKISLNEAKRV